MLHVSAFCASARAKTSGFAVRQVSAPGTAIEGMLAAFQLQKALPSSGEQVQCKSCLHSNPNVLLVTLFELW